ncbi:Chitobiosyldiphosphodolichol beta-mannosyltransferase [Lamellibrachia satsuma]|nr:Chitobiosyldiphosphodolichol beta-mannosyltransferase [Lamellibrachia satsuma]
MQYHSLSLADAGYNVRLIGYEGSVPHPDVVNCEQIQRYHLKEPPKILNKLPRLAVYVVKVFWQSATLLLPLLCYDRPSHILLQNPPAIPSLAVCYVVSLVRNSHLVVDWHNYGYTILGLSLGPRNKLVQFSKWCEQFFGRFSSANICVTRAMKTDLKEKWNIKAVTMYDRPPSMFRETDMTTQHSLFLKLAQCYDVFGKHGEEVVNAPTGLENTGVEQTTFTERSSDSGLVSHRDQRPALLVSSTSWTEDEDFSLLLNALEQYEEKCDEDGSLLPNIVCVITGKGPLKAHYEAVISEKTWRHVTVCTPWLEAEDYPVLLGSADLGVCLHMSSSGLDLPMKVVDMFGCGLPVCAVNFNCLGELVRHEENGMVFDTETQLTGQLQELLTGFPKKSAKLEKFQRNLKRFQEIRWKDSWKESVLPLFS